MADPRFFKNVGPHSLGHLADHVCGRITGNCNSATVINDAGPIAVAEAGFVTFVESAKYLDALAESAATVCIIKESLAERLPPSMGGLIVKEPYKAYAAIATLFYPDEVMETRIHPRAHVEDSASVSEPVIIEAGAIIGHRAVIGAGCRIGANATIGDGVVVGEGTSVGAGASLSHCLVGDGCLIYPGARIGQDGFGFAIDPSGHKKIPQLGRVIIGNGVEVGANTTVDRGAGDDTVIGDGCFIDNQVQIAHNVRIGAGSVIVAQAGIAGSTTIGRGVVIAAQVGVSGHLKIGAGSRIGAMAGVMRDVPPGEAMLGIPAVPAREFWRQVIALTRLAKKKEK